MIDRYRVFVTLGPEIPGGRARIVSLHTFAEGHRYETTVNVPTAEVLRCVTVDEGGAVMCGYVKKGLEKLREHMLVQLGRGDFELGPEEWSR